MSSVRGSVPTPRDWGSEYGGSITSSSCGHARCRYFPDFSAFLDVPGSVPIRGSHCLLGNEAASPRAVLLTVVAMAKADDQVGLHRNGAGGVTVAVKTIWSNSGSVKLISSNKKNDFAHHTVYV